MLYPIKVNSKYGFIDSEGRIVISPQYDFAYPFYCERAIVFQGDKAGVINDKDELVIPFYFHKNTIYYRFSENMVFVENQGFFDHLGNLKIRIADYSSSLFINGYAPICKSISTGHSVFNRIFHWGMIDYLGNIVIPVSYDQIGFFSEGICPVCIKDKTNNHHPKIWGFINDKNEIVEGFKYGCWGGGFQEQLLAVWSMPQKKGYINTNFQTVISYQFQEAASFSESRAMVRDNNYNGYVGYCNSIGEICIPCKFSHANSFSDGLAVVCQKRKWGFIDKNGNFIIPPKFAGAFDFRNGIGSVLLNKSQQAYINKEGNIIFTCEIL